MSEEVGEAPSEDVWKKESQTVTLSDGPLYPTYKYFIKNIEQIKIQLKKEFKRKIKKDYDQTISTADNLFQISYIGKSDSKDDSIVFFFMSKGNSRRIKAKIRLDPDRKMQVKIMTDKLSYGNKWIPLPDLDSGPIIYSTSALLGQSSSSASKSVENNGLGQSSASSAYESVENNGLGQSSASSAYEPVGKKAARNINMSLSLPNRPKIKKTFAGGKRRRNKTKKVHRRRRL